ncbi:retinoblastoma-like protein 1 [Mytilus galloprovincialis]|uniref:Retinoblastoma-like protein 1 n=3 Tax=Mytilus galloprovincialis TaxID=29158 RepID=A0A8B6ENU8_MYTGA|nr:retinoblastoma-like protein 1 [Mytilus galloprovincialis]
MGLSEDGEDAVESQFEELCLDLNMDKKARDEALENYQKILENYSLEGNQLHWLVCALYEACRRSVIPTVGRGTVEGNCVSLTRLLRSSKFSLIQFFNKMKKWSDMANLRKEFRDKIDRLERNFAVSTVIFKKFEPIFLDIFRNPMDEPAKQNRSRKQRRLPCSSSEVFNFCWTMFVHVKGHFPAISDDLVNSYHLLLCCIDWVYANSILGGRKDLLNSDFQALPEDYESKDWKPPVDPPCIIKLLCEKHEGLEIEAKVIKEHWWKPHIRKLFEKKVLKGKTDTLSAVLEIGNFEFNSLAINKEHQKLAKRLVSKAVNSEYEEFVLSVGDFDERIFLGDDAEEEIGTPAKSKTVSEELDERIKLKQNLEQHFEETKSLAPLTPLTGRRYLKDKDPTITPVSTATQSVGKLQLLLSGRKTSPSDALIEMFSECPKDPIDGILSRVREMGEVFCNQYVQPTDENPGAHIDFAKRRLQLGESLYYKILESIVAQEKRRLSSKEAIFNLLEHDAFHRCLFACCLEIVIFSYNSQRKFPWIVEIFDICPYYFYRVVEIIIRAEDGLSRDVVKHLNHVEECILESHAWKRDSPLWTAIQENNGVPVCEEVILPSLIDSNLSSGNKVMQHPAVKRLVDEGHGGRKEIPQSPQGPSAADRFSSPSPGSAKRRLFGAGGGTSSATTQTGNQDNQTVIAFQQAQTEDGRQILIPLHTTVVRTSNNTNKQDQNTAPTNQTGNQSQKPKKTGSLALFFRKLYHMSSVRLRDLCERLHIEEEDDLRRKIWTCFEHTLVNHTDLIVDHHIDQILMCAIYVMSKVTGNSQSFQNIMKCYRMQPQAQSHVYRSVLLTGRRRHTSGGSDGSKNGASRSSSPTNNTGTTEKSENRDLIRSTSTLPVPHPGSHPPTPIHLTLGGSGSEAEEERGDLIMFYNQIYISRLNSFAKRFSATVPSRDCPALSPLPMMKPQTLSPRRVSSKYPVYISPHKQINLKATPATGRMHYCFNRSPAKDLRAINNMIKMGDKRPSFLGKRSLGALDVNGDEEGSESPTKLRRQGSSPMFLKKLQSLGVERREANGSM